MAYYAFLDSNNIVTEVITGIDENELIEGLHPEIWYGNFKNQKCKRTSYNTINGIHLFGGKPFRKNFASIGYFYDEIIDAFIPPKPFDSWILNQNTCNWESPIPYPQDGKTYIWNNDIENWSEI